MKRRALRLSRRQKLCLYSAGLLLLISGAAWAWADRLDVSEPGWESIRPLKAWLLRIHGFSAIGFVLVLGTLLPGHVWRAWQAHKNRTNGAFFLLVVGCLILSGYGLYYLGDESWRSTTSKIHLWLGLATPLLLYWHIWSGRKATG